MKVIDVIQGSDEWHVWRGEGVTATDGVILLGASPYKTVWRLWAEKVGYCRPVDLSMNPLVRRGNELEDTARIRLEEELNDVLLPVCVQSSFDPLVRASLDGITSKNEPTEIKCPSEKTWNEVCAKGTDSDAYKLYYPQVQHQLLATGSRKGYLAFYFEGEIKIFIIHADTELLKRLYAEIKSFWQSILNRVEPAKDVERDLYIPLDDEAAQWLNASESYRSLEIVTKELKDKLKEIEEQKKPLIENLKGLMGEYLQADFGGLLVTRYKTAGRVNYKQLLADKLNDPDLDVEAYREEATERCRITATLDDVMPRHIVEDAVIEPLAHLASNAEVNYF